MTTVGSLAYSIVANTQNFTAGLTASRAELKTLKDAFIAGQTPTERYSMAIQHLQDLAQKFPAKAEGINRTIHKMREEMAGGFHAGAEGGDELSESLDKINNRLGRMTLSEVMGTLKEIPGATVAIDLAFGNWIGAAVGAFSMAHEMMEESLEATNKTADAYESATEKLLAFYEAEDRAREKGQARDRLTDSGLSGEAEGAAAELGYGAMGYAASTSMAGKGQRFLTWLGEQSTRFTGIGDLPGAAHAEAVEKGEEIGHDRAKSRELAEKAKESERDRMKFIEDRYKLEREAAVAEWRFEKQLNDEADAEEKQRLKEKLDEVNRVVEAEGRRYDKNEQQAEAIAKSQMTGPEKLREEFEKLQELQAGGFFDLHPEAYERSLIDLKDRGEVQAKGGDFKGIVNAVSSASREGIAARFGMRTSAEEQRAKKAETQRQQTNTLLSDIKTAIKDAPTMGIVD
jgi:hypothetical protein